MFHILAINLKKLRVWHAARAYGAVVGKKVSV
jgi:hypothetical protein